MIRVLIADDHAIVRKGLKQIIMEEFLMADVGEVNDVEGLIKEITDTEWDVIICDINMPGRSGLEAIYQVKQTSPRTPLLMLSMHSEDQYATRVLRAGASGYLNKDSVHVELVKAIHTVRAGKKYITPRVAEKLAGALLNDPDKELYEKLSDREFDVFKLLASGKTISEIALQLSLGTTTVSTYRSRILEKMEFQNNAELTRYALEKQLI